MAVRQAVRGLLVTPDRRKILLIQVRSPVNKGNIWMTPGGGKENGESDHDALIREIWEETGLKLDQKGAFVFDRQFSFETSRGAFQQFEKYFLLFVEEFSPTMNNNPAEAERNIFQEFKWWPVSHISASSETFAPPQLAKQLVQILT